MSYAMNLPSYKDQSDKVRERFERLYRRPVKLELDSICKQYDNGKEKVLALENVSMKVMEREFISIVGPSGCGKSTLIRMIAGLDFPTSGSVLLENKSVSGPCRDRGMVFQSYTLFPWLTVKKNVMFGLEISGASQTTAESEAREWIHMVGLDEFENAYPYQLSGGMKQRVAIARSLANNPQVLMMDEPFGALDAQTRCSMQSYLIQLWRRVNVTILFVTHDLDEAIYLADRILVLDAKPGRIREIIEVPVERPRSFAQFLTPEFLATKKHLESLIHPDSHADDVKLPNIRMTSEDVEID